MDHDPELQAAAYLEGMPAREHAEFEDHLLACEACWQEVPLAHAGRELAESIRDRAPAQLRQTIRAAIAAAAAGRQPGTGWRGLARALAAAVAVIVMIGGLAVWRPWQHPSPVTAPPGSAVDQAVARFREDRLPGITVPAERAPDLGQLGLRLVGIAAGTIDGTPVTVFAYRGGAGSRLDVYRSARPIPQTGKAHELDGNEGAWRSDVEGVAVVCGPASHTVLLIGTDPSLVDQVGELLDVV